MGGDDANRTIKQKQYFAAKRTKRNTEKPAFENDIIRRKTNPTKPNQPKPIQSNQSDGQSFFFFYDVPCTQGFYDRRNKATSVLALSIYIYNVRHFLTLQAPQVKWRKKKKLLCWLTFVCVTNRGWSVYNTSTCSKGVELNRVE